MHKTPPIISSNYSTFLAESQLWSNKYASLPPPPPVDFFSQYAPMILSYFSTFLADNQLWCCPPPSIFSQYAPIISTNFRLFWPIINYDATNIAIFRLFLADKYLNTRLPPQPPHTQFSTFWPIIISIRAYNIEQMFDFFCRKSIVRPQIL